jgi:DNA topoisomerase VI subunit A
MEFTFTHDAKAFAIPADKMQARERLGLPSYAAAFSSSIHPPFPPPSPVAQPSSLLTSANGKHNDDLSSSTSSFPNTTSFPARIDQSSHDASGVTHDIAREEVIGRIEEFICAWIATLSDNDISEPPTFEVRRRTKANTIYYPGERENGDSCQQLPGLKQGDGVVIKKLSEGGRGSARSYAAIFAILAFSHRILLSNQIATSREVWYNYKASHSCFKSQADCDRAVLDAASLLGVARHQLGIVGAAKGLLAGHFRFRVLGSGRAWNECDGGGGDGKGGLGCGGTLIDSCWITDVMEVEYLGKHRPRYIVVVEKECVFKRLIGDGLLGQAGGIVLITGKGYPDLATRACVKALVDAFAVPVVGLCDCNPYVRNFAP